MMKILLVGSFRYEMYAPAFSYGFRQLGHEVIEIDYLQYHLEGNGGLSTILNRIQDRYHYGLKMDAYNNAIIETVNNVHPNLVFFYSCTHVYASTLKRIKGKAILMSYNNDDPFSGVPSKSYYRHHIANAQFCDINYVYRKKNVEDYSKIGINNTKLLLPYYCKDANYPLSCEKDLPVVFIGHYEDDGRDKYIYALKNAGVPVRVYGGDNWRKAPLYESIKSVLYPPVRGDDYNKVINRAKVCLVFLSKWNHDTYTRRCFEIPAAKTVMLSEYTEDMDALFPENECALYFRTEEELINNAKRVLNDSALMNSIAQKGYDRLSEIRGSETDRCKEIIDDFQVITHNVSIRNNGNN